MGLNENSKEPGDDQSFGAFLAFIEKDVCEHPASLTPVSEEQMRKIEELTKEVRLD